MKKSIFSALLALGLALGVNQSVVAIEGNVDAGKTKAAVCAACHGTTGISIIPNYPNLAGQHADYIVKQLKSFKSGSDRSDAVMAPMAANLSEQDMADVAAYFASLPRGGAEASGDTAAATTTQGSAPVSVEINKSMVFYNGGDAEAGQEKSAPCVACHSTDGNSLITMYPKLAGQGAAYITKQLADFKAGAKSESGRVDPVMAGMVAGLSEQDMADLGAFFATQKTSAGNGKANDEGHKLYFGGDASRGITACVACHTQNGSGMSQAKFPSVAGQNVEYLTSQLQKFRSGDRVNDNNAIMRQIAMKLSDKDIAAVTQYMSSLTK